MLGSFTAKYVKIKSAYMGQIIEWPEVITEGKSVEGCRGMLKDALHEMILSYQQQGLEITGGSCLFEQIPCEFLDVSKTA